MFISLLTQCPGREASCWNPHCFYWAIFLLSNLDSLRTFANLAMICIQEYVMFANANPVVCMHKSQWACLRRFFLKRNVTSELALLQMLNDPFLTPSCFFFPEGSSHSVFPTPVLNHCCTVWWYTLSSKNFLLFTFSKPAWNEAEGKELERDGKK